MQKRRTDPPKYWKSSDSWRRLLIVAMGCLPLLSMARAHVLIFRADAPTGSRAYQKLLKSGLRFRRLKKSKVVLIEEKDSLLATDFRTDGEFSLIEEDRVWRKTDSVSRETPETDEWVPDFFENSDTPEPLSSNHEQDITLGIVDSGLNLNHPYFSGHLAVNPFEVQGLPGVDDDHNGFIDDIYGANAVSRAGSVNAGNVEHGTHVASLALLSVKESHFDSAQRIKILPVNFMENGEYGSTSTALLALDYALDRGAKVVNISWGGGGIESFSQALYESLSTLCERDVLVVAAAGNESNDNDRNPFFPANYNLPNLISVASVTPQYGFQNFLMGMGLSFFSNFGAESVDVAAPGDMSIAGNSTGVLGANGAADYSTRPFVRMMGTSMAAPVVSGVAAVMRALNRSLSAHDVKELLLKTSKTGDFSGLNLAGGVVSPPDAYRAALSAAAQENPPIPKDPVRGNADSPGFHLQGMGGCAQVIDVSQQGPPQGPFGGNSIPLFTGLYFLRELIRLRKSLLRKLSFCV
jgi:subtilisin family serine protease